MEENHNWAEDDGSDFDEVVIVCDQTSFDVWLKDFLEREGIHYRFLGYSRHGWTYSIYYYGGRFAVIDTLLMSSTAEKLRVRISNRKLWDDNDASHIEMIRTEQIILQLWLEIYKNWQEIPAKIFEIVFMKETPSPVIEPTKVTVVSSEQDNQEIEAEKTGLPVEPTLPLLEPKQENQLVKGFNVKSGRPGLENEFHEEWGMNYLEKVIETNNLRNREKQSWHYACEKTGLPEDKSKIDSALRRIKALQQKQQKP